MFRPRKSDSAKYKSSAFLIGLAVCLLLVCVGSVILLIPPKKPLATSADPDVGPSVSTTGSTSSPSTSTIGTSETSGTASTTITPPSSTTTGTTLFVPDIHPSAEKKLVALTFDDGPGKYTEELLDILARNDAKATFFVLGNRAEDNEAILKRMVKDGHEVAGHSYSHPKLTTISKSKVAKEINNCKKAIEKATGVEMKLLRAPYGAVNNTVKACAKDADLKLINWSVDTNDWRYSKDELSVATSQILKNIFSGKYQVTDGGIVLMHDIHEHSVDSVETVIYYLRQNGYEFVTVSELLDLREDGGKAGTLYKKAEP